MRGNNKITQDDSSNIVFQIIQWYSVDYDYDPNDISKYLIKVFGVTEQGISVSLNILDYTPFFFIKIHHSYKNKSILESQLEDFINDKFCNLHSSIRNSLMEVKIIKKKDFWGFTNNEHASFARFKFKNIKGYRAAIKILSYAVHIPKISKEKFKYKLYESNIDPFLRMMHISDIEPAGWVEVTKYNLNESNLQTHCQIDIECNWKNIKRIHKEKIAPLIVASYDLECTSSHGDFPVPRKNYSKVVYEIIQYFNIHKFDDNIKDTLQSEILKIFDSNIEGIFNKVFTKRKVNIDNIDITLKKNMDQLFTILNGKLQYKCDPKNYKEMMERSQNNIHDNEDDTSDSQNKDNIMNMLIEKLGDFDENNNWSGIFPELEGDQIIQIGTTMHKYGEKECYSRYIFTLGTCDPIENVQVISCTTEKELLLKWRDLIINIDPDIITGYNIFGFDMTYLYFRSIELNIMDDFCKLGRIMDKTSPYYEKLLSSSALGDNILKFIDMEGRVIIDIMKVVQRDHKLDSYKLDNVAHHFMKMNKNDVNPSDIFRLQKGTSTDRCIVARYCVQDCELCNNLIIKLEIIANNIGMCNVCYVPLSYIFMRGQGIKIFSLVAKECREADFIIPTLNSYSDDKENENDEGYEGATVLTPVVGIYIDNPIAVLDYASLYPSSMISENLSHDTIILNEKYDNLPGYEYLNIEYDVYEKINDVKVKTGVKTVRFFQNEKGTIPKILMKLLKQRKETRKKIEYQTVLDINNKEYIGLIKEKEDTIVITNLDGTSNEVSRDNIKSINNTYNDFQKAVLDGLQLAYKVTANSLYGQCGSKVSSICMKELAACTTATGRKMILTAKEFIEKNYPAETIYGDSVTGYTPILIRHDKLFKMETIEELAKKYGNNKWVKCVEIGKQDKESCEIEDVESWTSDGWTKIHRVIRHELVSSKKIIRIKTKAGTVDVTDDHSLLDLNKNKITPKDLKLGDSILHAPFPIHEFYIVKRSNWLEYKTQNIFSIYTKEEAYLLGIKFATIKDIDIPYIILNSSYSLQSSFYQGLSIFKNCIDEQVKLAFITFLEDLLGYTKKETTITDMNEIPYSGFVYDLTTDNHEFQAGIGKIIVHNTDSLFIKFDIKDLNGNPIKGKDAIMPSIKMAQDASKNFKQYLKPPHDLEYEKSFSPFILFSKKRYCAMKYEFDDKKCKFNSMGISLNRRDNAQIVKYIYGGCIDIILKEHDIKKSIKFLQDSLKNLIDDKYPLEDLVISKSLRSNYKNPLAIAHKVLADRISSRDPGNKPQTSDRIPYVYIQVKEEKGKKILQGNRIETPNYIKNNKLKPDYEFYIQNQIMKPVLQLYALILEDLEGYRKGKNYYSDMYQRLLIEKNGDEKKAKDRYNDLREIDVKTLLFDPLLHKLSNKKNGLQEITNYFKKI